MELDEESSTSAATTSSNLSVDYVLADQEYGRLIKVIPHLPQPIRSHITSFLYPFYVYVFIHLLSEDKASDALKFISAYAAPFLKADGYGSAVKSLFDFKTIQDVKNHSYFKRFCESKYVVKVSENSLKYFTTLLQETQCTILLTILFSHLHVEGIEDKNCTISNSKNCTISNSKNCTISNSKNSTISNSKNSTISNSKNCIAEESAPNISESNQETKIPKQSALKKPASFLYTITSCQESLCVADINSKRDLLACGFDNSTVQLWTLMSDAVLPQKDKESPSVKYNSDDSKESQTSFLEDKMISCPNPDKILRGHNGSVFGLAFTPNHEMLMTCSGDCTARAWDLKIYETAAIYSDHKCPIWDIAVSLDTKYFATASKDLTARLWSFERSTPIRIFAGHSADVDCVKFHSNGQYIATASSDRTIRLWTVKDARSVRHFIGHSTSISCIAFSPNGHHLASADDSGCIKIWDLGSGQQINEIHAHNNRILSIAYNKNGSILASGGFDNYLKVWDVQCCSDMKKSQIENSNEIKKFSPVGLIDSTFTDSILHFVSFRKRDLLLSVSTTFNREG